VAYLPHHENFKARAEGRGHAGRDRDAAAGQGEDARPARPGDYGNRRGTLRRTPPFRITVARRIEGLTHRGAKQHPRLRSVGEGGRTWRRRGAARGGTGHLTARIPGEAQNKVMICIDCRKRRHEDCRGGNWCDCQHQPSPQAQEMPTETALSWVRQG
jgi:hypothetical protein